MAGASDAEFYAMLAYLQPDESLTVGRENSQVQAGTWGRIPRTYIRHTADRMIPIALQDRMIAEADRLTPHNRFDVHTRRRPTRGELRAVPPDRRHPGPAAGVPPLVTPRFQPRGAHSRRWASRRTPSESHVPLRRVDSVSQGAPQGAQRPHGAPRDTASHPTPHSIGTPSVAKVPSRHLVVGYPQVSSPGLITG